MIYYAFVAPPGVAPLFDNRRKETKGNYNSYARSARLKRFLAKRIRAHDGCLGIGRRRRTRKTAISPGEPSAGVDPGVSEWGNPATLVGRRRRANEIARRDHTGGSETSQYPEERKSRRDCASSGERRRRSPNRTACRPGLRDRDVESGRLGERTGMSGRRG